MSKEAEDSKQDYTSSRSAFWRAVKGIADKVITDNKCTNWIQILRNKYLLRRTEELLNKYTKLCEDDTMDVDELIKSLMKGIDELYNEL